MDIKQFSGGQQGTGAFVTTSGKAYTSLEILDFSYSDGSGDYATDNTLEGTGVSEITAGTDQNGKLLLDILYTSGVLDELNTSDSPKLYQVATGVKSMSKGRAGLIDIVFSNGNCDSHSPSGLTPLTTTTGVAEAG